MLAERVRRGEIAEIAQGMGRDVERIIALHPEVLIQGVQPSDDRDDDLRKAGIAVVPFNNWQESTVLGRAEWMKFIGLLFGRNAQAEEAFRHIEQEYQAAQALIPATGISLERAPTSRSFSVMPTSATTPSQGRRADLSPSNTSSAVIVRLPRGSVRWQVT